MIWISFPRGWAELPEKDSARVLVLLNVEAQLLPVYGCAEKKFSVHWQDTIID